MIEIVSLNHIEWKTCEYLKTYKNKYGNINPCREIRKCIHSHTHIYWSGMHRQAQKYTQFAQNVCVCVCTRELDVTVNVVGNWHGDQSSILDDVPSISDSSQAMGKLWIQLISL